MAGLFIAFEGGEGAGKTTQSQLLADQLGELEIPFLLVREPGGTELGEYLRGYLKSEKPLSPEAELLLFEAARVELVTTRIQPALASGLVVIADRFLGSTVAYQGYGRGLDLVAIKSLNHFATRGIKPQMTILLDLPPEDGLRRSIGRQMAFSLDVAGGLAPLNRTEEGTRFEDLDIDFHERARKGFLEQSGEDPERWTVIDAARSVAEISQQVWDCLQGRIGEFKPSPESASPSLYPQGELWPQTT